DSQAAEDSKIRNSAVWRLSDSNLKGAFLRLFVKNRKIQQN
ncbi:MAG: hypothetical protein PWP05_743, partial [Thermovirga sp.]|nr:hypothetical protein [Thermovirga sp.]